MEILDELEKVTDVHSERLGPDDERQYYLSAAEVGRDAFDAMLAQIDPSWPQHVANITPD
jgi:hypothetical protein